MSITVPLSVLGVTLTKNKSLHEGTCTERAHTHTTHRDVEREANTER
jgi:hypothetical protein